MPITSSATPTTCTRLTSDSVGTGMQGRGEGGENKQTKGYLNEARSLIYTVNPTRLGSGQALCILSTHEKILNLLVFALLVLELTVNQLHKSTQPGNLHSMCMVARVYRERKTQPETVRPLRLSLDLCGVLYI